MEQINLKIDSKGRLYIPAEIRKEIGDTATLKKTSEGYLIIPGKREEFLEEFRKVITSEPHRTGESRVKVKEGLGGGLLALFLLLQNLGC